ncbi:hypothetical protein [Algicella marina]|uniref:Uncharacterized protein n=1 Tax=Algicella marina TaxID=2683284 RepID=A0A6P1T2L1_9RHOB|nr:hypothetical protein [Algicella marina]QHQ35961.1 hypothetical protein GO499_12670 [Algicella marina]
MLSFIQTHSRTAAAFASLILLAACATGPEISRDGPAPAATSLHPAIEMTRGVGI